MLEQFSSWWQIFGTNIVDKVLILLQVIATDNPHLATILRHKHSTLWSWSLSKFHYTSIVIVPTYWMHQWLFGSSLQLHDLFSMYLIEYYQDKESHELHLYTKYVWLYVRLARCMLVHPRAVQVLVRPSWIEKQRLVSFKLNNFW